MSIFVHMEKEKEILEEARSLFEHICDNVCPLFGDVDYDLDDEEWQEHLGLTPMEKEWYNLWEDMYDQLYLFIEKYE